MFLTFELRNQDQEREREKIQTTVILIFRKKDDIYF